MIHHEYAITAYSENQGAAQVGGFGELLEDSHRRGVAQGPGPSAG
jgi:hypothetical protein